MKFTYHRGRFVQSLLAAAFTLLSVPAGAQTVDIKEFFLLEPGHQWLMEGQGFYSGFNVPITATLTTAEGDFLHGTDTVRVTLVGEGGAFFQTFQAVQTVEVSLSDSYLLLHYREGKVYLNNELKDEAVENYVSPARLLPRLVTVGQTYPYQADLDSGSVDDATYVESLETVSTAMGDVETLKLVVFSDGDVPVTLWLCRNVGFMKTSVATSLSGQPLSMEATFTGFDLPWNPGPVDGLWANSIAYDNGWRSNDWLGYFWTPSVDSAWINQLGFGWAYCLGNSDNLWLYINGLGWFWTSSSTFPWMFQVKNAKFLLYGNFPGTYWFWDPAIKDWVNLAP